MSQRSLKMKTSKKQEELDPNDNNNPIQIPK